MHLSSRKNLLLWRNDFVCTITNFQVEIGLGGTCLLVTGFKVFAEFFLIVASVRFLDFCKTSQATDIENGP